MMLLCLPSLCDPKDVFNKDGLVDELKKALSERILNWKRPPREWFEAKTQFAVMFKERFVLA